MSEATPENIIEVNGNEYERSTIGLCIAIFGGALTTLIITAPLGIPLFFYGFYMWWKFR